MAAIDLDLNPPPRTLRNFGFAAFVAFCGLATMGFNFWSFPDWLIGTLSCVGSISGIFSVMAPTLNRPLYVVLSVAAYPIGLVMSYVVLGVLFYLILTPVAFLFRLMGRDVLRKKIDPAESTYWVRHEPVTDPERYFRQF